MKTIAAIAGLLGLLIFPSPAPAGQTVLEVIPLQHRSADEIIPALRPLLDSQGALSGMQGQLIVRTTPANLREIKRLLAEIDTAPRRLRITVKQDVDRATARRLRELSGSVGTQNARAAASGGADDTGGVTAGGGRGDDRMQARVYDTRSLESDLNTHHLQVLEGSRAFIRAGQSLVVPARSVVQAPLGVQVIDSLQYRDATSGFYVLPRVSGEQVTLEVSPQREAPGDQLGSVDIQRIATTVSGRLGEWIDLGGVGRDKTEQAATTGSRSVATGSEQRTVLIRVEEVR